MIIPYKNLSQDALLGLIEEFVSREGTDYGEEDLSLEQKVAQVKHLLETGRAIIVFDEESETSSILSADQLL